MCMVGKYFNRSEFACKCGCGFSDVDINLIGILNQMREEINQLIIINSGCRCEEHNKKVGGSKNSSHVKGLALDIKVLNSRYRYLIIVAAINAGINRIGIHSNFIHIDIDKDKPEEVIFLY